VNAFGEEDDLDGPADQCGNVEGTNVVCCLRPGHSGSHMQITIGTEEIGVESEVSRLTNELKTAYVALEAYQSMTMEQRVAAVSRLVEKNLISVNQALGLSQLIRERNVFLQRLLLLKAEARAVVETNSDEPDVGRILQGRIRVRELLRPGPEDKAEREKPDEIPEVQHIPPSAAEAVANAEKAVALAALAEADARDELAKANGAGTQIGSALYLISKAKLARIQAVNALRELRDGYR